MPDNIDKKGLNTSTPSQTVLISNHRTAQRKKLSEFQPRKDARGLKRQSFQDDSEADLLEWIKDERAIFWAWVFINRATCDVLETDYPELEPHHRPYEFFALHENPVTSEERLSLLRCWFRETEKCVSFSSAYKIMLMMRKEWLYIKNNINSADWLKKTEVHTRWLWDRLKKDDLFSRSIPFWFNPSNARERYLAINATLDFFNPEQAMNIPEFTQLKNKFTKRESRNYTAKTSTNTKKICQVSVNLSPDAKVILDKLVVAGGKTQSATIEWLIRDRWATSNLSQNDNKRSELNDPFKDD
ncbi:hypothetical protein M7963_23170 [Enterobacter roggenkampii]|uniref:hypothetical protein n=1 Tax=Enterobacter roggenkampii TaxID=1812935 RepID=UPI002238DDC5|nr:hypothetical protein [Enterobacter roggenkampii]MCW5004390.1 hypothetical protein [Enterobacter roggenkampii]